MQASPRGMRLQIGIFGKRNAGKSSLLNFLAGQNTVIVSDVPGTTTDPVDKAMELPPLGPVLLIDTAGLDDDQPGLGQQRVERSIAVLDRCDLVLLVTNPEIKDHTEDTLISSLKAKNIPYIIVSGKADLFPPDAAFRESFGDVPFVAVSAKKEMNRSALQEAIIRIAPEDFLSSAQFLGGLSKPGEPVLLITPIDKEAPKGRLIMPQVQAIRDALDNVAYCVVTTPETLPQALANLKNPPVLAVTDSQVFGSVAKMVPDSIPLTSFSILLARMKGDLATCAAGAAKIADLKNGSRVLIAEACTHHAIADDIGRVKIPNWIREYTGCDNIEFVHQSGPDFPADLNSFDLVIHCGACTFNRKAVLSRILRCQEQGVPFTNYGVAIAFIKGILMRTLSPFPEVRDLLGQKELEK